MTELLDASPLYKDIKFKEKKTHRNWFVAGILVLLCAIFGFLLFQGLSNSIQYFKTVPQALSQKNTLGESTFRVEGEVRPNSLSYGADKTYFQITSGNSYLAVQTLTKPPQLFRAGIAVVLVGHFINPNSPVPSFLATQIMVKHSASYVAAHPNRVKE